MYTQLCLRWNEGRTRYRPTGELFQHREHEVSILDRATAKAFILRHHYSRSFPAARLSFGLHKRGGELVGVAVFSHPVNDVVLSCLPGPASYSTELGRFVLLDQVKAMGETWFLGRAFAHLRREGFVGVVSFSDPQERTDAAGRIVQPGHFGHIYQGHNAVYLGRGTARTIQLLPSGRVLNDRAIQKVRGQERGWRTVVALLEAEGAAPRGAREPRAWLAEQLPRLTRPLRHPGNHKYAWGLQRWVKRSLPPTLPFPSFFAGWLVGD